MSATNSDFTIVKGKGLHNFSVRPANATSQTKQESGSSKLRENKKPE